MAHTEPSNDARNDSAVLLADGDPNVRSALRLVLNQAVGLYAIGEAANANELLRHVAARPTDLVVLDWNLPGLSAEVVIAALRARAPAVVVLVISTRPEPRALALAAGADAFVCKSDGPTALVAMLLRLMAEWTAAQVHNSGLA